jgi:hypothetical protein
VTAIALKDSLPAGGRFAVRVMVTDAWDQVVLAVEPATTVADLKRQALARALKRGDVADDSIVKFHGALVLDESVTLGSLGARANAPFIILPARRRAVR